MRRCGSLIARSCGFDILAGRQSWQPAIAFDSASRPKRMMVMKIDGSCHCGYVTYDAEADPERTAICNCTDCQTLSGAPFRAVISTTSEKFRILSGEPTIYVKIAESGAKREQAFCPRCGSPIYSASTGEGQKFIGIRVGTVRQRNQLVPKAQIWTRSRQAWINDIASIPSFETQPDAIVPTSLPR
jgi:hypothetical protein